MVVKTETCAFSGFKIYPGHGMKFIRGDSKGFILSGSKTMRSFRMRRNPRKLDWTILYRRQHKKGTVEEVSRRKTRKTTKLQRAIEGCSLDAIKAKRNQKPEVRQAQRQAALREVKERNKSKQAAKGATKKSAPKAKAPPAAKNVPRAAAGGKKR